MKTNNSPLTRTEATLVATWLQDRGKVLRSGWASIWKFTPKNVADLYDVKYDDILIASHRVIPEQEES